MFNRLFQGIVHQLRDAIDKNVGVIDETGAVISCSDLGKVGEIFPAPVVQVFSERGAFAYGDYLFRAFGTQAHLDYAVFIEGTGEAARRHIDICCVALSNIKQFYDEKYDRGNFVKNVIIDNILPGDIYLKARELRFESELARAVVLIRLNEPSDVGVFDLVQDLFPDKKKDFVINISETDIVVVKEVREDVETSDLEKMARSICESLHAETQLKPTVGIGTTVMDVKELARSFREAQVALEVGKVFDTEKAIVSYNNLGIARLIYQLPTMLCEMFLHEIFKRESIETLDTETLFTIQKFFENNLNVSETSRKLFVHRNTLVYRLEKIKRITGLDLREFDDAIVFKVALMVKKYLDAKPVKF